MQDARDPDEVLRLLRRAHALMEKRSSSSDAASPLQAALYHLGQAIEHLDDDQGGAPRPPSPAQQPRAVEPSAEVPFSKSCCSQETQTFCRQSASIASQASPTVSSTSTATGPQQAAMAVLGASRRQMQENRGV